MVETRSRAFGCPLRYIQGPGELNHLPEYTEQYGCAIILIDGFLFARIDQQMQEVYGRASGNFKSLKFTGECCEPEIERIIGEIASADGGVVVGIGGGKTMDAAKLVADQAGLPLIIAPSAASTDAPVSEIAVLYTAEGEYIGSRKVKHNAHLVLVDSELIVSAPPRLFVAGIGDALATWIETKACLQSDSPNYIGRGYRSCLAGKAISQACYKVLQNDALPALMAVKQGVVTEAVENVIEANTLLSGLGFLNTGLATAHGVHSGLSVIPESHAYLHGEKVSFGIVVQMVLENYQKQDFEEMVRLLVKLGLPVSLGEVGIEPTEENIEKIAEKTIHLPLIHQEPFLVTKDALKAAIVMADQLGRKYLEEK